jgi:hypothetical protein
MAKSENGVASHQRKAAIKQNRRGEKIWRQ